MNADGLMVCRSKEDQSISSPKGAQGESPGQSVAPPWDSLRHDDRHGHELYRYQLAVESKFGVTTRAWATESFSLTLVAKYHDSIMTPPLAETNMD